MTVEIVRGARKALRALSRLLRARSHECGPIYEYASGDRNLVKKNNLR